MAIVSQQCDCPGSRGLSPWEKRGCATLKNLLSFETIMLLVKIVSCELVSREYFLDRLIFLERCVNTF